MSNQLENGTVLPSGLLTSASHSSMSAFKKTYQNSSLRVGVVIASYSVSDSSNVNKKVPEYDVFVFEQNENTSSTTITYKNCVAATGFGSKTDFFEARLRSYQNKTTKDPIITPSGQNGAIVLLLCLNGLSDTGIIISSLSHPDRTTTLTGSTPHLEGEYNGVNIKVNDDGSTSLTFNGAKDNDGKIIDSSQGVTEIKIEKDGSFQVDHSTITFRLDKTGTASLTAKKDVDVTAQGNISFQIQGNADINVKGKVALTSGGDTTVDAKGKVAVTSGGDTSIDAKGKVAITSGGNTTVNATGTNEIVSSGKTSLTASEIDLNGSSGQILTTLTDPVVDLITGVPTMGVPTVKAG